MLPSGPCRQLLLYCSPTCFAPLQALQKLTPAQLGAVLASSVAQGGGVAAPMSMPMPTAAPSSSLSNSIPGITNSLLEEKIKAIGGEAGLMQLLELLEKQPGALLSGGMGTGTGVSSSSAAAPLMTAGSGSMGQLSIGAGGSNLGTGAGPRSVSALVTAALAPDASAGAAQSAADALDVNKLIAHLQVWLVLGLFGHKAFYCVWNLWL